MLAIKPVTSPEEIQTLDQVIQEIWPEVYTKIIGADQVAYMLRTFQSKENIEQDLTRGMRYFLLMDNNQPVGYTAYVDKPDEIYLSKLYLHKKVRGKGYGSQVFQWYESLASGKTLRLNVNKYNEQAIAVYEARGFERIEACQIDIGEGYIMDDFVYEKVF